MNIQWQFDVLYFQTQKLSEYADLKKSKYSALSHIQSHRLVK